MSRTVLMLAVAACLLCPPAAFGQSAREILIEAEKRNHSRSEEYTGEVVVTARNGTERRKTWRSYREGSGPAANRLMRFLAPPEVRGVGFLSRSRPGRSPDQWMYLPSMKRERRIASQDRHAAFVGTDFNYEDLEEFDHSKYEPSLVPDETIDGHVCHVIELVPADRSVYEKKVIAIRKDTLWILRVDLFRAGDRTPSKELVFSQFEEIDGHWIGRQMVMTDRRKGSYTTVSLVRVAFDRPQPPDRFTLQNLVREGGDDESAARPSRDEPARVVESTRLSRASTFLAQAQAPPTFVAIRGSTGYLEAAVLGFFQKATDRDPPATFWGTAFIENGVRIGPVRASGSVRAELISSSERGPLAFDPADRASRRSPLSLRELSAVVPLAPAFDLQVGRFVLNWGKTDAFSPADTFLPRDASDPFADEKLPLWGARLQGERGPIRVELYGSFVTTPWRLPRLDGHYSPFTFVDVYFLDARSPPPTRGFEVARVQRTGETWDLGLWVRTGIRPAPVLVPNLDLAQEDGDRLLVPLDQRFARENGFGVQISREVSQWMLRGEVAHLRSRDPDLKNALLWTAEAERSFRSGTLILTAAGNAFEFPFEPSSFSERAFLPAFVIATTQDESWGRWDVSWLGTFRKIGGIFRTELVKDLSDTVKLTVGSEMPYGSRLESPGAFARARRARTSLRWSW